MVNACVTGILPRFRYVLLSDALLESLTPLESAAVFGHEIGHVAHRHFLYFAFFFMGSLGVLSLFGDLVSLIGPLLFRVELAQSQSDLGRGWCPAHRPGALFLVCLRVPVPALRATGRRLRQQGGFLRYGRLPSAHRSGQRARPRSRQSRASPSLCPVGIRIFADALTNVARFNGLDRRNPIVAARFDRQPDRIPRSTRTASGARTRLSERVSGVCVWAWA